jgi:hypothetical protein
MKKTKRTEEEQKQWRIDNRDKLQEQRIRYRKKNKERIAMQMKEFYKNNPQKMRQYQLRRFFDLYGITMEQYKVMYDNQEGKCPICGRHENELVKSLCIDHDHKTGSIRDLLCVKCNVGLGWFDDDIERLSSAILYLKKHNQK